MLGDGGRQWEMMGDGGKRIGDGRERLKDAGRWWEMKGDEGRCWKSIEYDGRWWEEDGRWQGKAGRCWKMVGDCERSREIMGKGEEMVRGIGSQ